MKKIYIFFIMTLFFTGCETFLDEPQPTDGVASSQVFSSEAAVRAYFTGVYRNLRSQWTNDDESAGGSTDTWGVTSVKIAREIKGGDIMIPSGWYQWDYRHENRNSTYRRTNFLWAFYYEAVNQANIIIANVASSSLGESAKKRFTAEAKTLRAWAYFNLVREYAHNIPSNPGVPIYTEPSTGTTQGNPRSTVGEVYSLIVSDLESAVQDMASGRLSKSHFNVNVSQGILARVHLTLGNWAKAKTAAQQAREGYPLVPELYGNGFDDTSNPEWIWGFAQSNDQTIYYGNLASHYTHLTLGYSSVFVNDDFVNTFSGTDVRNLFLENFYGEGLPAQYRFITTKFTFQGDFSDDLVMMRAAEMFLIEAEAEAELGNDAAAGNLLFELQQNRDPQAVKSGNTGQALINEILLERRKELYGEIGVHYLDLKRRQMPLVRTGNHPAAYKFEFEANGKEFLIQIPQKEIDANVNMTEDDQNEN